MFRTHMRVDTPGGMGGVDADLAELRALSGRVGDRWMRAQVASAAGEAGMARGNWQATRQAFEEALRLAREVGAHMEAPFLLARLAELRYRSGDMAGAEAIVEQASLESERYGAQDAQAYVRYLRADLALARGEHARSREILDGLRKDLGHSAPPPQFTVLLDSTEGRLVAYEQGPAAGLRLLLGALRTARAQQCSDLVVAHVADAAAGELSALGEHSTAVRLLAAATGWLGDSIRPVPEAADAAEYGERARAVLGVQRYEAERVAGERLGPDEAIALLDSVLSPLSPRSPMSPRPPDLSPKQSLELPAEQSPGAGAGAGPVSGS